MRVIASLVNCSFFSCFITLAASTTNLPKPPVQRLIPYASIGAAGSAKPVRPESLTGFDVDSLDNLYFLHGDPKTKSSHLVAFSPGAKLFDKANAFYGKKLFAHGNLLLTGYHERKTLTVKLLNKTNGSLLKTITITAGSVINDFFFDRNLIVVQYFAPGKSDASYEYYSYNGSKAPQPTPPFSQGSKKFLEAHVAEGPLFLGAFKGKLCYVGTDLSGDAEKIWLTAANSQPLDSTSLKSSYLGNPLLDITEFSKLRGGAVWAVRAKKGGLAITKVNL